MIFSLNMCMVVLTLAISLLFILLHPHCWKVSQPNYRQSVPILEVIKKVYDQILEQNQNNFCDLGVYKNIFICRGAVEKYRKIEETQYKSTQESRLCMYIYGC